MCENSASFEHLRSKVIQNFETLRKCFISVLNFDFKYKGSKLIIK